MSCTLSLFWAIRSRYRPLSRRSADPHKGDLGVRLEASFVLAMVPPELAAEGTDLKMDVLGTLLKVTVVPENPFDPDNERLRA